MNNTVTKGRILGKLRKELPHLRERYGVEKIAIYGSYAKGKPRKKSDVDILVQLMKPLGLDFIGLAYHLEKILRKKVDLATFETLKTSAENPRYARIASDIQRTLSYV
jgi:uncharacterized protein